MRSRIPAGRRSTKYFLPANSRKLSGYRANPYRRQEKSVSSRSCRRCEHPDDRVAEIPDFPCSPRSCELDDDEGGRVRWPGSRRPADADPVCCCTADHPSRFRTADDPDLVAARHRVIYRIWSGSVAPTNPLGARITRAPGTSNGCAHSRSTSLDLRLVTLYGQTESGSIELSPGVPESVRISRIVVAERGLPTGDFDMPEV